MTINAMTHTSSTNRYTAGAVAVVAAALMAFAAPAQARSDVSFSVGIGVPGVVVGVGNAYPVYSQQVYQPIYQQQPVYQQPMYQQQPVYVQPAPIYVQPPPVYYSRPPVYYAPQPIYYNRPHGHGYRNDDYRGHRPMNYGQDYREIGPRSSFNGQVYIGR